MGRYCAPEPDNILFLVCNALQKKDQVLPDAVLLLIPKRRKSMLE